jgi:branched-chain amino acid transport system permease protein
VLKAIRDNEPRAISLGYRTERYKLAAFVMSASLAGLAGATKAIVFQLASLTDVHWSMSGEVVLMTLLGGMGTIFGPVRGRLRDRRDGELPLGPRAWVTISQGIIFVVCVLAFRRGIVGELEPGCGGAANLGAHPADEDVDQVLAAARTHTPLAERAPPAPASRPCLNG